MEGRIWVLQNSCPGWHSKYLDTLETSTGTEMKLRMWLVLSGADFRLMQKALKFCGSGFHKPVLRASAAVSGFFM